MFIHFFMNFGTLYEFLKFNQIKKMKKGINRPRPMATGVAQPARERSPSAVTVLRPHAVALPVRRRRWLPDSEVDGVGTAKVGAMCRARWQGRKLTVEGRDRSEAVEEMARRWRRPVAGVNLDNPTIG
jgi:hypothetical protein